MDSHSQIEDHRKDSSLMKLTIKFMGRNIPIEVDADSTITELKSLLQTLTDVLPRGQKLIFKGKVLADNASLRSSEINDGSKVMLLASQGLHQGDDPSKKKPGALASKRVVHDSTKSKKAESSVTKGRFERWKATGVIALSDNGLPTIPEEVWTCVPDARVLDLSHNAICEIPAAVGRLSGLRKLLLDGCYLPDNSIDWEGITSLKFLEVLSLNLNYVAALPSKIGTLTCLKQLHLGNNNLTSIPSEIGFLTALEVLKAQNNRLKAIPTTIGQCVSLVEVDFSRNFLAELPDTLGNLKQLKALYLSNNGLKTLPNTLFKMCLQLSILDLHCTEITMDLLRQFEGWENFNKRRREKHQKQLDFRVTGTSGNAKFDEGADKNW